ncbi:radical SAM protein [archaeon]|nr:radical SAM protein [archaeon]
MVNILINYDCNKSCSFCFQKGVKFKPMSLENFKKTIGWLDHLEFFQDPKSRRVSLIGGEPTLHPQLRDMINILKANGIKSVVFSNLVFNKTKLEMFDKDVVSGFVSTYNPKKSYTKKEYEQIEHNIKELQKKGFDVKLSYNITKNNLDYKYVLDACKKHKLESLRFSTAFPNPTKNNDYLRLEEVKRHGSKIMSFVRDAVKQGLTLDLDCTIPLCALGSEKDIFFFLKHVNATNLICKSAVDINPDLSMYYCLPRSKEVFVENILDYNNLREINEIFEEINQPIRNEINIFPECETCKYKLRNVCQGGCLALKKTFTLKSKKKNKKKATKEIIGVKTWGGIGDGLMTTPALKALKKANPKAEIRILCNDNHKDIFQRNPNINYLTTNPKDPKLKGVKLIIANYGRLKPSLNFEKSATEIIADLLEVKLKSKKFKIFLTKTEENKAKKLLSKYKSPIIVHANSKCSKNQIWFEDRWNKLVAMMPEHTFIQLGLEDEPLIEGVVDLRGKTSVREAIAILKYSKCFVGVISFLAHATNAVNTKGVVLFGPSTPVVWGYKNNINLYKHFKCAPCIDILGAKKCPYNRKCMQKISVKEVKKAIQECTKK